MRKRAALVVTCLAALGCGGGTADYSSNFTGTWSGSGGFTEVTLVPPATTSGTTFADAWGGPLQVTSKSLDSVDIAGVCPGGDGPAMDVVSSSVLSGGKYTCAPTANVPPGCSTASTVAIDGGSGTLVNGAFTLALTGKYTFCGRDYAFTFAFQGGRN